MGEYTQLNLLDVEDQAESFGLKGVEARFPHQELGAGMSLQKLEPGVRMPFGHKHEHAEEVYVVLAGSGRMKLDDEIVELKLWDAVRVSPPVTRGVEAGLEGLQLLVVNSSAHTTDTAPIPGWWSD